MGANIQIASTISEWTRFAAKSISNQANQAIQERGYYTLVLSGGSTPATVYQTLAADEFRNTLDWENCYIFWGDERCVPPEHEESNFKMAKLALLDRVPIPKENIFRIFGELNPSQAARNYEKVIDQFFDKRDKRFDTVLLGVGNDGHTASLFPGTEALTERSRWVIPTLMPDSDRMRVSLTFPAINNSRNILLLAKGQDKATVVAEIILNAEKLPFLPAKGITGKENSPTWILDKAAAEKLPALNNL